nr:MAG TPA: hypothetical protein [Caudoviricetes sp.]
MNKKRVMFWEINLERFVNYCKITSNLLAESFKIAVFSCL